MKKYKNELLDALCFYFVFLFLSQKRKGEQKKERERKRIEKIRRNEKEK